MAQKINEDHVFYRTPTKYYPTADRGEGVYIYDKEGKLYRTIESKKVEEIQGFPTVTLSLVQDLKSGSKTEMTFSNIRYDIGIGEISEERYLRKPPQEVTK